MDKALTPSEKQASNVPELTVGELSGALKRTIEDRFGFVRVRGEISNYRGPHSSGHAYFCLKDEAARIDAVVWKTTFQRLKTRPQEGLEVIASGRLTTFPGKSTYQIVIESIEPAGIGALMAILEARRKALAAQGLFDESRKRPLPFLPRTIGVVTSPTGAVIRDILHRIEDRFPRDVLVWPVRVQGETAATELVAAIAGFDAMTPGGRIARPDVLIVARGGGSLEDLWAFNEEVVVHAAAACTIPLIAAVGHETDWTLIDHVADLRAPTPSGAAEKAVPVRADLVTQTVDLARRHHAAMLRGIERRRRDARALARALPHPDAVTSVPRQRLDRADMRLIASMIGARDRRRLDLARLSHRLAQQAPLSRLAQRKHELVSLEQRMTFCVGRDGERRLQRLFQGSHRLISVSIVLQRDSQRAQAHLDRATTALARVFATDLATRGLRLAQLGQLLGSLGYRQVLARGFALVRDGEGRPLRSVEAAIAASALDIEFSDGHISASAGTSSASRRLTPLRPDRKAVSRVAPPKTEQGSLF